MLYAALSDMLERFDEATLVQLTAAIDSSTIDENKINTAIESASSIADGYLAKKYQLPLVSVPIQLVDITCDLALRRLWKSTPPEDVTKRETAAIATLKDIAKGLIKVDQGVETQAARPGELLVAGNDRLFSRDSLVSF